MDVMTMEPIYYTLKQIAEVCGKSPQSIYNYRDAIDIGTKIGGHWLFTGEDLKAMREYIAQLPRPGNPTFGTAANPGKRKSEAKNG